MRAGTDDQPARQRQREPVVEDYRGEGDAGAPSSVDESAPSYENQVGWFGLSVYGSVVSVRLAASSHH